MISLCMIVKDEERFLPRCLQSVQDCVDEMIIVDTGSTDNTVGIAKSFGAKVHHHTWENDFSKHRNQSIGYAEGDWIFWLDADEELAPDATEIIKKAVENPSIDSLILTMVCYFGNRTRESWNNSVKLFRNHSGIHFEGAVHNQVVGYKNPAFCPVKIFHYGYDLNQKTVRKKFDRTAPLLKEAIKKDPSNFRHHHDLAVSYASVGMFRNAVEEGLKAIKLYEMNRESDSNILWTYFVVSSSLFNLGELDEAGAFSERAIHIDPEHFDSHFVLASIRAVQNDLPGFEEAYRQVIRLIDQYKSHPERLSNLVMNKISEKWRLDLDYGILLLRHGRREEAEACFQQSASRIRDKKTFFRLAIATCRENRQYDMAGTLLNRAAAAYPDSPEILLEKAVLMKAMGRKTEHREIIRTLMNTRLGQQPELMAAVGTEALLLNDFTKAESLLKGAVDAGYEYPRVFTTLALACKYQGKIDQAVKWNLRALDLDEEDMSALPNLGHIYFDQKMWEDAGDCYARALRIDGNQIDALFRMSLISMTSMDLPACVQYCDHLMKTMGIGKDMTIDGLNDLAFVYRSIGEALRERGKQGLYQEAVRIAETLENQWGTNFAE